MLIAQAAPPAPKWVKVSGAEVLFAPIDRGMMRRARKAALEKLGRPDEGASEAGDQIEELGDALSEALIVAGVRDWRDVGVQRMKAGKPVLNNGEPVFDPLPFTLDNLARLLADPIVFEAFDAAYVIPFVARSREKNASAVSPSGIGEAGTREKTTAGSRATPRKRAAAKPARIASTRSKPKRAKGSGTS